MCCFWRFSARFSRVLAREARRLHQANGLTAVLNTQSVREGHIMSNDPDPHDEQSEINEEMRESAEDQREVAERGRESAEDERVDAEQMRKVAEEARKATEEARKG